MMVLVTTMVVTTVVSWMALWREKTHLDGVKACVVCVVWILDRLWGLYLGTEVRYQLYRSDTVAIP